MSDINHNLDNNDLNNNNLNNNNLNNNNLKKSTFEATIGKNIMGILASVLIFAGLTLFATAVSDYISDGVKLGVIVMVSMALFIVGLVGKRKKKNAFFMSLAGCGIGAVFISIFLAYGYFHMIEMVALYVLLAVWSIAVALIGGEDSSLFRIAGQTGIIVSLIFGVSQLGVSSDADRMIWTSVLVIFFILVSVAYLFIDHKNRTISYQIELISDVVATVFLYGAIIGVEQDLGRIILYSIVSIYSLAILAVYSRHFVNGHTSNIWVVYASVATVITSGSAVVFYIWDFRPHIIYSVIALLFILGIVVINQVSHLEDRNRKIVQIIEYIPAIIFCGLLGEVSSVIGVGLLILPLVCVAYITKDKFYSYLAVIATVIFSFFNSPICGNDEYFLAYCVLICIFVGANVAVNRLQKETLSGAFQKIGLYLVAQIFIFAFYDGICSFVNSTVSEDVNIVFIVSAILCIGATLSSFSRDWKDKSKRDDATRSFLMIVAVCLFVADCIIIYQNNGVIFHLVEAIIMAIIMSMNTKYIIDKNGITTTVCIYNCFKLTVYVYVLLGSLDAAGYIVSAGLIAVAIACIIFGFIKKYRPVRLFGLILSIVSIVKIVLVDIEYNSSITRAITIFVCGIIAFAICLVYNILDKSLDSAANNTAESNKTTNDSYKFEKMPVNNQAPVNHQMQVKVQEPVKATLQNQTVAGTVTENIKVNNTTVTNTTVTNTVNAAVTGMVNNAVPLYFVQYIVPGPDGKPMAQMIPVYKGQAMKPIELMNGMRMQNLSVEQVAMTNGATNTNS